MSSSDIMVVSELSDSDSIVSRGVAGCREGNGTGRDGSGMEWSLGCSVESLVGVGGGCWMVFSNETCWAGLSHNTCSIVFSNDTRSIGFSDNTRSIGFSDNTRSIDPSHNTRSFNDSSATHTDDCSTLDSIASSNTSPRLLFRLNDSGSCDTTGISGSGGTSRTSL